MKNIRVFYLKIFSFLKVKFSIYLNRRVFVMRSQNSQHSAMNISRRNWSACMKYDKSYTMVLYSTILEDSEEHKYGLRSSVLSQVHAQNHGIDLSYFHACRPTTSQNIYC